MELELPHDLTGHHIQSADGAVGLVPAQRLLAPAQELLSRLVLCFTLVVISAHLAYSHIEESRPRAVRRAEPVGGALQTRPNERPLFARTGIRQQDGAS